MKMTIISDIRFFESLQENIDGSSLPTYIGEVYKIDFKILSIVLDRFVLKLRENDVTLPGFDHIYICFTPLYDEGAVRESLRSIDKYHPRIRNFDVGYPIEEFNHLSDKKMLETLINLSVKVINNLLVFDSEKQSILRECAEYILLNEENSFIIYKRKKGPLFEAQVITRILDDGTFRPQINVIDNSRELIREYPIEKAMRQDEFRFQFGEILLSAKTVTIKPKKNAFSQFYDIEPIHFDVY